MTSDEKIKVRRYRHIGLSYTEISRRLGVLENTVKSYCKRNGLGGNAKNKKPEERLSACKQCDAPINNHAKGKPRKFCSDNCRRAWWQAHDDHIKRKAYYTLTCARCGRTFESYGNKNRKFCGHACYIQNRFGQEA